VEGPSYCQRSSWVLFLLLPSELLLLQPPIARPSWKPQDEEAQMIGFTRGGLPEHSIRQRWA